MTPTIPTMRRRNQAGFTLMMVIFMVASILIVAAAGTQSILTQGRREKEEETVWRGQQYERAIGLYYRKFAKYPTKIEDLTNQTNGVRFLRQAYADPMNKEDGSWRFIYVGPGGQLIGSLRQTSLLQNTLSTSGIGGATPFGGGLQSPSSSSPGQQTNSATTANTLDSQPQPLGGPVLGGNIIGVGSKIDRPSFRIYLGGDTYQMWEFIWNPKGVLVVNPNNSNYTGAPGVANPTPQTPQQDPQAPGVNPPPPAAPPQ
jgi:type II secretory pathway pseudopilin PulG